MIRSIPRHFLEKAAWSAGGFGFAQACRFATNVALAALLAPALLGVMVIVNTIRNGVELLSDVGITQNIVSHKDGGTREFLDTAWTVQALRGLFLGLACFLLADQFASIFGQPILSTVLPVASLFFIFSGFWSTNRSLLQKQMSVKSLTYFEIGVSLASLAIHVVLALISPTIWALILGSVFTGAITMVGTFMLMPKERHRILLTRPNVKELFRFGKWIFFSSVIFFASMNFDRLYFAERIPLAALGVYGVARTLAETITNLSVRVCSMTLFPMVAAAQLEGPEVRRKLLQGRRLVLLISALGLGFLIAFADGLINLFYDNRYSDAGIYLPIMLMGAWFALLSTINESVLIGLRLPAPQAFAHLARLLAMLAAVPVAFAWGGIVPAVIVLSAGEIVRYLVLWGFGRRAHVAFGRDDLALTCLLIGSSLFFSYIALLIGISDAPGLRAIATLFNDLWGA